MIVVVLAQGDVISRPRRSGKRWNISDLQPRNLDVCEVVLVPAIVKAFLARNGER
jgi:hypothetical protein